MQYYDIDLHYDIPIRNKISVNGCWSVQFAGILYHSNIYARLALGERDVGHPKCSVNC